MICIQEEHIVSVSRDGTLKVWDHQGVELTSIPAHSGPISQCAAALEPRPGIKLPAFSPLSPLSSLEIKPRTGACEAGPLLQASMGLAIPFELVSPSFQVDSLDQSFWW